MNTTNPRGVPAVIRIRHRGCCPALVDGACACRPAYEAGLYSKTDRRKVQKDLRLAGGGKALGQRNAEEPRRWSAPRSGPNHARRCVRSLARACGIRRCPHPEWRPLQAERHPLLQAEPRPARPPSAGDRATRGSRAKGMCSDLSRSGKRKAWARRAFRTRSMPFAPSTHRRTC